jgi:glycosyltransferase involved in cell wall biosynthesis
VLALDHEPSGRRGGQERSLLDVCRGLAERGHAVTLGYNVQGDMLDQYRRAGVTVRRLGAYAIGRDRLLRSSAEWLAGVARAAAVDADVVYVNQYQDTLFGAAVARLRRLPLVCHLRLFPPERFCGQWTLGLGAVTRFVTVSAAARDAYIARGFDPATIDLVYNGIDTASFVPASDIAAAREGLGVPQDAFVVVYAGRIDPTKNLERVLDAFAALGLPASRARLLVAGRPLVHASPADGERYAASLRDRAQRLGIGDAVHWLGARPDIQSVYAASDACILLSAEPETFGRSVAEAMSCGIPCVASDAGGIREILAGEFAAWRVDPMDREAATARLATLVDWRRRDPALGARARAHIVANFPLARMVEGVQATLHLSARAATLRAGPPRRRLRESLCASA